MGQHLRRLGEQEDLLVVGVSRNTKVRTIGEAPRMMVYQAYSQAWNPIQTVLATTTGDAEQLVSTMMVAGRELDPDLWVWEQRTMARHLGVMLLPARLSAFILSSFAGLALLLAVIGLHGVVSYSVSQRTREVGIRLALGADGGRIVRLLASTGLRLVAIGVVVGVTASVLLSRLVGPLVFGGVTLDAVTLLLVPATLVLTALVATYVPARRASRLNPVAALRED